MNKIIDNYIIEELNKTLYITKENLQILLQELHEPNIEEIYALNYITNRYIQIKENIDKYLKEKEKEESKAGKEEK